jgi:tetratricopeptide (TPR) repeat protein
MVLALAPVLAPGLAPGARAESASLRTELDTVYQTLLVDPSDRVLNRRLIEIAVELEDYDAAIGAVERLIFYEPDNAALQLEAARYYLKIESYAAAAGYLKAALGYPNLSGAQRNEATTLLAEADRATRPSPWAGFGQVGARYQTNANHGSVALGLDEPLPFEKPEADWNSFALGTLALTEPVNDNLVLEATVSGYYADQDKVDRLDLGFAEATVGPRLVSKDGTMSVKPYAIAQGILLGGEAYQSAVGGGVLARYTFADDWWIEPQFEYKNRSYYKSDNYPTATDQTGALYAYSVGLNGRISENVTWSSLLAFNQNQAAKAYQSYDQYTALLALQIGFDLFGVENWSLSPFVRASFADYKGVSPTEKYAGLDTKRRDELWSVGANLEIPLRDSFALGLSIEYSKNVSNLDRDDYENLTVVFGPQGRF